MGSWIRGYNALFKVPVLGAPSFDGMRAVSPSFQMEIDATIDELLAAFGVEARRLDPADHNGWIGVVMDTLGLPPRSELLLADLGWSGPATAMACTM